MTFDPSRFGPVLGPLVDIDRQRSLDEGSPSASHEAELQKLTLDEAFAEAPIADKDMARCCLAGIWLLHDFLDRSHAISQSVSTPTGSFWHGMMHRREGDFSNAKYWFRRVGEHEVYAPLAEAAAATDGSSRVVERVAGGGQWDAFAFVDACQSAIVGGDDDSTCRRLQQLEWELLFEFCYRRAVGD